MTPSLQDQILQFIGDRFRGYRVVEPAPDGRLDVRKLDAAMQMSGGRAVTADTIEDAVFKQFGVRCKVVVNLQGAFANISVHGVQ